MGIAKELSEVLISGNVKCQIVVRDDGRAGVQVWSLDEADKGIFLPLEEAEAVVNALTYYQRSKE